jgi:hypothetical protein
MLPDFRLMIAATLASVVVLMCGFGVFATFRVSHEPFVRLPAAAAPAQLVAANTATPAPSVTAAEPFDHRFQSGEAGGGGGAGNSALAYSAPQAAEQPAMRADLLAADDHARGAAEPEPAPTPADSTDGPPTTPQQAAASDPAQEAKADEVTEATSAVVPASAPSMVVLVPPAGDSPPAPAPAAQDNAMVASPSADATTAAPEDAQAPVGSAPTGEAATVAQELAAVEPLAEPPLPPERPKLAAGPPGVVTAAVEDGEGKARRNRAAARTHRARSIPAVGQDAFAQSNFVTAAPAQPTSRRSRINATTAVDNSFGAGGPFVSAPTR